MHTLEKTSGTNTGLTAFEKIYLSVSSLVVMIFVTCSSPLYSFNPWTDANVYMTLGRGILHGLAPYRDLYDQKGPLLFLIHAAAALISEDSFIGVWLIEIAMAIVFSCFAWKTVKLLTSPGKHAVLLMPAICALTYTIGMMDYGDSAEELCFPLIIVIMYLYLRDSAEDEARLPSPESALIIGILTACLFWIKYTFTGPVIAICILMVIRTVKHRTWKMLLKDIGMFLAGFAVLTMPIIIFLAARGALQDMFTAYFYNNIVFYSNVEVYKYPLVNVPVIGRFAALVLNLVGICSMFPKYPVFLILCIAGVFLTSRQVRSGAVRVFFVTYSVTLFTILSGKLVMSYYAYITVYLAPFAAVTLTRIMARISGNIGEYRMPVITAALSLALTFFNIATCKNLYMLRYQKSDYPQYKFAEVIKETPDACILTYDVMDGGFYMASGTLPKTQYYCYLNIEESWPVILEEQDRLIGEQAFDYIITRKDSYEWDGYEIAGKEQIVYSNITGRKVNSVYCLYKKIS